MFGWEAESHRFHEEKEKKKKTLTSFPSCLSGAQIHNRGTVCPRFPHPCTAVADHASGVGDQDDEFFEWNVLHREKQRVVLNPFLPHDAHHLFASCGTKWHEAEHE